MKIDSTFKTNVPSLCKKIRCPCNVPLSIFPLLENLVYLLLTLLVSEGTHIPCYCFFHCVGGDGARNPEVHEPTGWGSFIGVRDIEFHPALSSRKDRGQAGLLFSGICPCKSEYVLRCPFFQGCGSKNLRLC